MTELRFHREIYVGEAIDEAVKVFAAHASFDLAEEDDHWVVRFEAKKSALEPRWRLPFLSVIERRKTR